MNDPVLSACHFLFHLDDLEALKFQMAENNSRRLVAPPPRNLDSASELNADEENVHQKARVCESFVYITRKKIW